MKLERKIGDHTIVVWVTETLTPLAEDLLDTLAQLDAKGPRLKNGSKIGYGWTVLTLREDGPGVLRVFEPALRSEDAEHEYDLGATETLRVMMEQATVNRSVGADPVASWYHQEVRVEPGVLDEQKVYLQRHPPRSAQDSGWYVGSVAKKAAPSEDQLETMAVWKLFERSEDLIKALALPVGYIAVFDRGLIDAILDPSNKEVFRRK